MQSPLVISLGAGVSEVALSLIEKGANLSAKDKVGAVLVHSASSYALTCITWQL